MGTVQRAAVLALALLLTACAPSNGTAEPPAAPEGESAQEKAPPAGEAVPPEADPADGRQYKVYLDAWRTLAFDRDGQLITEEEAYTTLKGNDGKPQCRLYTRIEDTGKKDDYGYPVARYMSALYDLDGSLLADWAEISYSAGFGDFVIRCNDPKRGMKDVSELAPDYYSELWNFRTGETIEGVEWISGFSDGNMLALGIYSVPLGVLDAQGSKISGFPAPEGYTEARAWNDRILAVNWQGEEHNDENLHTVALSQQFEPVFSYQILNESFFGLRGPYLLAEESGGKNQRVMAAGGDVLYVVGPEEEVEYFDGECMILNRDKNRIEDAAWYCLKKPDGTVLADGFSQLQPADNAYWNDDGQAPAFISLRGGLGEQGCTAERLDRDGKITATADLPGADDIQGIGEGYFTYRLPDGNVGLLDPDLNTVIPAGGYSGIWPVTDSFSGEPLNLLECRKEAATGVSRSDLYSLDGTLMVSNLTQLGDAGPDRLAVVKGFSAGLMDWQGNWISKQSIFGDFEDERSLESMW